MSTIFQRGLPLLPEHSTVTAGMYVIYVADWLSVIPRDRFMFIQADEYFRDRFVVLRKIAEFLGLGKTFDEFGP